MRLTNFCDYSLRVLIFLGMKNELSSVAEISEAYGLSKNHIVKVVHNLSKLGYIHSFQGRKGGIELAVRPEEINLGKIIKQIEPDFDLVECFNEVRNGCNISPACRLKGFLFQAKKAFLDSLGKYSLADIIKNRGALVQLVS
ncbi:MAG: Rrf2 family transcriptional regulator [Candidatus Omnitrophica bacterium]|nr:Rrf2 family transcriptional regulator [Candidatus Omnitrophota bacterium]